MPMTAAVGDEQGLATPFCESKPFRIEEFELDPPQPGELLIEGFSSHIDLKNDLIASGSCMGAASNIFNAGD